MYEIDVHDLFGQTSLLFAIRTLSQSSGRPAWHIPLAYHDLLSILRDPYNVVLNIIYIVFRSFY